MAADTFSGITVTGGPAAGDPVSGGALSGGALTGSTVIIELGLDRGEPDTYRSPTRSTVPAWLGPIVIAVLVLFSSVASAAPPPPPLSTLFSLRVSPTDAFTVTDDGQLLAQTLGTVSMYNLGSG